MIYLGLIESSAPTPVPAVPPMPPYTLHVEDALASVRRLWIRGWLLLPATPKPVRFNVRRGWVRWRRKAEPAALPATLHLETRVGGQLFEADAAVRADGRFEATFV